MMTPALDSRLQKRSARPFWLRMVWGRAGQLVIKRCAAASQGGGKAWIPLYTQHPGCEQSRKSVPTPTLGPDERFRDPRKMKECCHEACQKYTVNQP